MTRLARCHMDPKLANRFSKVVLELGVEMLQKLSLLAVDQRGLGTVTDGDRQDPALYAAAPAVIVQRFRQQSAQTLRDVQLQAHPGQ